MFLIVNRKLADISEECADLRMRRSYIRTSKNKDCAFDIYQWMFSLLLIAGSLYVIVNLDYAQNIAIILH